MNIKETGLNAMTVSLKQYPSVLKKEASKSFKASAKKMVSKAKSDHRFKNRSGKTSRSIKYKIIKNGFGFEFYLDGSMTKSGKYAHGIIQMEGSARGYRDSEATEGRLPSKGKGKGVQADHFMDRAYKKELPKLVAELTKNMNQTAIKVGMK